MTAVRPRCSKRGAAGPPPAIEGTGSYGRRRELASHAAELAIRAYELGNHATSMISWGAPDRPWSRVLVGLDVGSSRRSGVVAGHDDYRGEIRPVQAGRPPDQPPRLRHDAIDRTGRRRTTAARQQD